MEQLGIRQKDLAEIIGFKSRVSEILNKKRRLNLEMIRKLNKTLNIPTDISKRLLNKFVLFIIQLRPNSINFQT